MSKHTPGPWAYEFDPGYCGEIQAPGRTCVARFVDEPSEADARLISAAPDLLAVAVLLSQAADEGDDASNGTHYVDAAGRIRCKGSFLSAIEQAREAIHKATGAQA